MKALVYRGPGRKAWEETIKPTILNDTDAIIRVDAVTICGTDLHILKRDVPEVTDGRILGHTIDGTQAEYVRVPFADTSTYQVPAGVADEQILMLADILPTGYEVGVLNGCVQPGDVVAVVGAGPIGLDAAEQFGADVVVNNAREDAAAIIAELTGGLGADVSIEAVGIPETFEQAVALTRSGGHIANVGVHGQPATLDQFEEAYDVFARAGETGALKVVVTRA